TYLDSVAVSLHRDHRDPPSFPTRRSSDLRWTLPSFDDGSGRDEAETAEAAAAEVEIASEEISIEAVKPLTLEELEAIRQDAYNRSEEHTSELQSRENLVCRLLLEKKKITL